MSASAVLLLEAVAGVAGNLGTDDHFARTTAHTAISGIHQKNSVLPIFVIEKSVTD